MRFFLSEVVVMFSHIHATALIPGILILSRVHKKNEIFTTLF